MKTLSIFLLGARQVALGVSLAVISLILFASRTLAQDVTLDNGGSTATVNLGGGSGLVGMNNWSVNAGSGMQNQLDQQWFWYSVNGGTIQSIDQIGGLTYSLSSDDSTLYATYQNSTLSVGITYTLQGSGVDSGAADLMESINITNNMSSAFNINFYQYSNFNLLQNNQNTISIFGSPGAYSTIVQTTMVGGNGIEETIDNPLANYAEAGVASSVYNDVAAGNVLNGTLSAGPGDVGWGFEWTDSVGAGDSLTIYKDKDLSIAPIPEPGTAALIALGLGACALVRRRQSR